MCVCVCVWDQLLSHVQFSATPGSCFQAIILEQVAISYSRGYSRFRDWTCVSCIGWLIPYHCATWHSRCLSRQMEGPVRNHLVSGGLNKTKKWAVLPIIMVWATELNSFSWGQTDTQKGYTLPTQPTFFWTNLLNYTSGVDFNIKSGLLLIPKHQLHIRKFSLSFFKLQKPGQTLSCTFPVPTVSTQPLVPPSHNATSFRCSEREGVSSGISSDGFHSTLAVWDVNRHDFKKKLLLQ